MNATLVASNVINPSGLPGVRVRTLQLYNWGTFHERVWSLNLQGRSGLITGVNGSGKSTLVDAITTLLMPAHRVSYNKAAGANHDERDLRAYVLGYYSGQRSDTAAAARPKALRGNSSYTVILAVFANERTGHDVTLAQVFWPDPEGGQPKRFYTITERALSIEKDFADFGSDIRTLKKRLRDNGTRVFDTFPEYGRQFSRLLDIESDQALGLFHQMVSMKDVDNLDAFVRTHMLSPGESQSQIDSMIKHFESVTDLHDSIVAARDQITALEPILKDCELYQKQTSMAAACRAQRDAAPFFFATRRRQLHEATMASESEAEAVARAAVSACDTELAQRRDSLRELQVRQAGLGGNEIATLAQRIDETQARHDDRRAQFDRYQRLLGTAGLDPVSNHEDFLARSHEITALRDQLTREGRALDDEETAARLRLRDLQRSSTALSEEIDGLRQRTSNIPQSNLNIRRMICDATGLAPQDLPFAGELIAVRDDQLHWEGAAERVLRNFGLSLLVPEAHYPRVSQWINDNNLRGRLVYYRVPVHVSIGQHAVPPVDALIRKLNIREGAFSDWLRSELIHRARHICTESLDRFRAETYAVTPTGQIRANDRHEKDDTRELGDRRHYVLGWANEAKISSLIAERDSVDAQCETVVAETSRIRDRRQEINTRLQSLTALTFVETFDHIDWASAHAQLEHLLARKAELERASAELAQVTQQINDTQMAITAAEQRRTAALDKASRHNQLAQDNRAAIERIDAFLSSEQSAEARKLFSAFADIPVPTSLAECDEAEQAIVRKLTLKAERCDDQAQRTSRRASARMASFNSAYPNLTADIVADVDSSDAYRALHTSLANEDLPRFEKHFEEQMHRQTISSLATFSAKLTEEQREISTKIEDINSSLKGIDYNPGRYLQLEIQPSNIPAVAEFCADLRNCTSSAADDGDNTYSEAKFEQVSKLIKRLKGREGSTEADRRWRNLVTDVRNWVTFAAVEIDKNDDSEVEYYADSSGKSGGQKEKLAYTILAAALAYQYNLQFNVDEDTGFRFVIIDEAFSKADPDFTRFALNVFKMLGLQILIVTPKMKLNIIEPFVSVVTEIRKVEKTDERGVRTEQSQLSSLTIERVWDERRGRSYLGDTDLPDDGEAADEEVA